MLNRLKEKGGEGDYDMSLDVSILKNEGREHDYNMSLGVSLLN